ncbi:MAG: DUF4388 domain-containing protein [Acidobacteria bacterium]|nr:DUF4388 domain-containing protein [Acidobacteriota bacterium]
MALVGKLEDLNLTELFHMLSLFQKSGRLTLSAGDKKGVFLFKEGKIIHAANGSPRVSLGQDLLSRGLISESTLRTALDMQAADTEHRRLGTILVANGAVTEQQIERLIRERLQAITKEFLHSNTGFFSFKPEEHDPASDDDQSQQDVDLPTGMNTDGFILDLLTRLDAVQSLPDAPGPLDADEKPDSSSDLEQAAAEAGLSTILDYMVDTSKFGTQNAELDSDLDIAQSLAELRSLMVEIQLRSPSFTGEITLMILRFATRVVNRGVLCHVAPRGITGIGQFGLARQSESTESVDRRIRSMAIPLNEPSVFMEVFETMHSYQGRLKKSWWNDQLIRFLGGPAPTEVVIIPIIVDGLIQGLFYGDNVPHDRAIGPVHALELLMIEAGLAMEKTLLRARLKQVQDQVQVLETLSEAPS